MAEIRLLEGVRVIEASLLEPGTLAMVLADLGADVIKVEQPGEGDYVRRMAWPIVDGVSLLHWHISKGKRSIAIDLRTEQGHEVFCDLVRNAEIVVEGMRPGALERRGLGYDRLRQENEALVQCTISGYGITGPYRDLPAHGIAFDAWSGVAPVAYDDGSPYIGDHVSIGTRTAPLFGALGVLAALTRARASGKGCRLEIAQTDAAAAINWLLIEGHKAYERPEDEVTGNPTDGGERRAPGIAGMKEGVRYQYYESADGYVLLMASEREFWENFCRGVGRLDLFEANPGGKYADHARGNTGLQAELREILLARTTAEWVQFGLEHNTPICPVNEPGDMSDDPQFQERMPWLPAASHGADLLPSPIKLVDDEMPGPHQAPTGGHHTDKVLDEVLGYDRDRIGDLRDSGAVA